MSHAEQEQEGWTERFRKAFVVLMSDTSIYYPILLIGKLSENFLSSVYSTPLNSLDLVSIVQHL